MANEIKTNFSFDKGNLEKSFNRLIQDLSSNFKKIKKGVNSSSSSITLANFAGEVIDITVSTNGVGVFNSTVTINHNLGAAPSGYILVELTKTGALVPSTLTILKDSFTDIDVTFAIFVSGATASTDINLKVLLLR